MNTINLSTPLAALMVLGLAHAQQDLNSLRQREWAHRTPEVDALWRIDDNGSTNKAVLEIRSLQAQDQPLMSLQLPITHMGAIAFIPYRPTSGAVERKFELIVGGAVNSFDTGTLPVVTGAYCRVIVDYVPGGTPLFSGTVTQSVNLAEIDPIGLGWTGYDSDEPDRIVLHDGQGQRLLLAAGTLGSGLLPRSAYTEELGQFPLDWMRRGFVNQLNPSHPDNVLRVTHQSDTSRYLTVQWDAAAGGWTSAMIDRPAPAAGSVSMFRKRFAGAGFSPNSLPEVLVAGTSGTATITLHDAGGNQIGTPMSVAKGQWSALPPQTALNQHIGGLVRMRVDGEVATQKIMRPMARFGAPYSNRSGFSVSTCMTSARYDSGRVAPHGFHVLTNTSVAGDVAHFGAAYAIWDPTLGPAPVVPTAVPGVSVLAPQAIVTFAGMELDRINGGLGLDISSPPASLDGKVLLCQYVLTTASGEVVTTDICGTRIFGSGGSGGSGTAPVAPMDYLTAQVSKYTNGTAILGNSAVIVMGAVHGMIL